MLGLIGRIPSCPLYPVVFGGIARQGAGFETIFIDGDQHNQACKLSDIGALGGILGLIGGIGLLPLCGWRP